MREGFRLVSRVTSRRSRKRSGRWKREVQKHVGAYLEQRDVLEVRVRGKGDKEASKHSVDVGRSEVLFGDLKQRPRGRIKMRGDARAAVQER